MKHLFLWVRDIKTSHGKILAQSSSQTYAETVHKPFSDKRTNRAQDMVNKLKTRDLDRTKFHFECPTHLTQKSCVRQYYKSTNARAQLKITKKRYFAIHSYPVRAKTRIIHSTNQYKTLYPYSSYNER